MEPEVVPVQIFICTKLISEVGWDEVGLNVKGKDVTLVSKVEMSVHSSLPTRVPVNLVTSSSCTPFSIVSHLFLSDFEGESCTRETGRSTD